MACGARISGRNRAPHATVRLNDEPGRPSQDAVRIEHYSRDDDGNWTVLDLGPGDQLVIDRPNGSFAVDDFYRDLPPPEPSTS